MQPISHTFMRGSVRDMLHRPVLIFNGTPRVFFSELALTGISRHRQAWGATGMLDLGIALSAKSGFETA